MLLVAERLLSLRLSMNTPVVATDELPAGPARAAIAIHSEAGRTCFTVAVRSLRQGVSVLYELEGEDFTQPDGLTVALDASLSFGESMGFLFDDDMLVDREPATLRQAVAQLREIVSAPGLEAEDASVQSGDSRGHGGESRGHGGERVDDAIGGDSAPAEDDSEILLEEALEQAAVESPSARAAAGSELPSAVAGHAPPAAIATPGGPMLTKFRAGPRQAESSGKAPAARPAAEAAPSAKRAASSGGARLGRVQPIRLRAPGAAPAVPPLLRLLAAF